VNFAAITLCVVPQRIIPKVSIYFVIDSVRKLLGIPSYVHCKGMSVITRGRPGKATPNAGDIVVKYQERTCTVCDVGLQTLQERYSD
jgi:hypothetical protein